MKRIQTNTNKNNEQHNAPNIKDRTYLALANGINGYLQAVDAAHWPVVESEIREATKSLKKGISFEPAGIYEGFFLIKSKDKESLNALRRCNGKISFLVKRMRLSLIPASQIPKILENQALFETPVVEMAEPPSSSESDHDDDDESQQQNIDSNEYTAANVSKKMFISAIKANYIHAHQYLLQMANIKRLTQGQKRSKKKAMNRILKYERKYGLSCQETVRRPQSKPTLTVAQKDALDTNKFANKHNKMRGESFKQNRERDYVRAELPSASLSYCEPQLQNFNQNENYRRKSARSELPSTSLNYCDPQLQDFDRNENYRTESPRSEFTSTSRSYLETEMMPAHTYPSMNFDNSNSESLYERRNDQRVDSFSRTSGNSTMRGDWSDFPSTSRSGFQIPAEQYSRAEDYYETAHFSSKRCRTDSISNTKRWPDYTETNNNNNFHRTDMNADRRRTNNNDWEHSFSDEYTTPRRRN